MRRPRVRLAIAASLVPAAVALGISCSFPVLTFQDVSTGSGSSTSASTATSSTMATTTSSAGGTGGAGGAGGSTTSESASTSGSTSSGGEPSCQKPCDCDGDNHIAYDCPKDPGDDCADYDPRAYYGAGYVYDGKPIFGPKRPKTTSDDFNCDESTKYEYDPINCAALVGSCSGDGFTEATACGTTGKYITCSLIGLCKASAPKDKVQGCK